MPEATTGEMLHRLLHAYKRALRQAYNEAEVPLTVSHMRTLKGVQNISDCTAQAIATRTHRDKAQITRLLKDLIADGLVEKHPHPEDRRSQILHVTEAGTAIINRIRDAEAIAAARMAAGLGTSEMAEFNRLAGIMTDNLRPETCPNKKD